VKYKVTEKEIIDYWQETFKISGEDVFNTANIDIQDIIKFIFDKVNNNFLVI
jgi:hypothetical protein